jgi:L,D-peptidoglycan transpeptidase YkuD (ErfK/YbiS/YcfS/YnhG family)
MLIHLKNKDTLIVDDFELKCCIGKNGIKRNKIEGDKATPKGIFKIKTLYYRNDKVEKPICKLKIKKIKKINGWCNNPNNYLYNKEIRINKKNKYEKLYRYDNKYDYLIVIEYNTKKIIPNKGSAIFIHLTNNYKRTAGCIALKKKDFIILAKVIDKKTKIKI